MSYPKGYVFELMEKGGPTDVREEYFGEAIAEMERSRDLCQKANKMPVLDLTYHEYFEELFHTKFKDVKILTPFYCDLGNRVTIGAGVFLNQNVTFVAGGGIELMDGAMIGPNVNIISANHDFNDRHNIYLYKKVTIKNCAWIGANATILPGVTIGEYAVIGAGSVVTRDVPDYALAVGNPARIVKMLDPSKQKETKDTSEYVRY